SAGFPVALAEGLAAPEAAAAALPLGPAEEAVLKAHRATLALCEAGAEDGRLARVAKKLRSGAAVEPQPTDPPALAAALEALRRASGERDRLRRAAQEAYATAVSAS